MSTFTRTFHVRWGDLDFNGHMKNTAYLDLGADVRMLYFAENGFSMREFERLRIGPVIMRDELEYFSEMRLLEPIVVDVTIAGLSEDGSRFRIRNGFFREDGRPAARVTSTGGWLDHTARRLVAPPEQLARLLSDLPRGEDFEVLRGSSR